MSVKIAVPWPSRKESQQRVKEALELWQDKQSILLCLVEPTEDVFVKQFDHCLLRRNSLDIGTTKPKPYILDMVTATIDYPADYYGFGNSDIVPVGELIDSNHEVFIYHRTEIADWPDRFSHNIDQSITDEIEMLTKRGLTNSEISRQLNKREVIPPTGFTEWNYKLVKECIPKEVFFWGQDLFLFRKDIVERVIKEYLELADPILCTGGFDPRLSRWLSDNFDTDVVINKIYHKRHWSEWTLLDPEYLHNGGEILMKDRYLYYNHKYLKKLKDKGYRGTIPSYLKYLVSINNPEVYAELFGNKHFGENVV